MARSGRLVWTGRLALAVLSLSAALLICELTARLLLPPPQWLRVERRTVHPDAGFGLESEVRELGLGRLVVHGPKGRRLVPNARAVNRPVTRDQIPIVIETNRFGLRDREVGTKTPGEFRVLVMGDSVTMGTEVHEHELYTSRATERAAGRTPAVRFVNAGVVSADLSATFYHLLELLEPIEPDLVVLQLYLNDARMSGMFVADVIPSWLRWSRFLTWAADRVDGWRQLRWTTVAGLDHDGDRAWIDEFVEHQRRVYGGDEESFGRMEPSSRDLAATDYGLGWSPEAWTEISKIVTAVAAACGERGIDLALLLAPVDLQVYGDTIDTIPQEHFAAMCRRLDLPCLDLLPALRAHQRATGEEVLFDQCHLRPVGHDIVAAELVAFLDRERLLPPPPVELEDEARSAR